MIKPYKTTSLIQINVDFLKGEKEELARGGFFFHDFELNRWIGDWEIRP